MNSYWQENLVNVSKLVSGIAKLHNDVPNNYHMSGMTEYVRFTTCLIHNDLHLVCCLFALDDKQIWLSKYTLSTSAIYPSICQIL